MTITIRKLTAQDKVLYTKHLVGLDKNARHDRFECGMSDGAVEDYASACFGPGDHLYGAFVENLLVGVGEMRFRVPVSRPAPHTHAEAAMSVDKSARNHGIGTQLFARIIEAANEYGIDVLEVMCLNTNTSVKKVTSKFHMKLAYQDGVLVGQLQLKK